MFLASVDVCVSDTFSRQPVIAGLGECHRVTAQHRTQLSGKVESRCAAPRGTRVFQEGAARECLAPHRPHAGLNITPESQVHVRVCSAGLQSPCFGWGILRGPREAEGEGGGLHVASWPRWAWLCLPGVQCTSGAGQRSCRVCEVQGRKLWAWAVGEGFTGGLTLEGLL